MASIKARARNSFVNDDRENISKYLDWARSTLVDYSQNNRRTATLMLIIVAIFELVAYSRNASISVGSFVVARGSVVLDFLPAIAAYMFFQIIVDLNKADQLQKLFTQVFAVWSEKAEENDLDAFLRGQRRSISIHLPIIVGKKIPMELIEWKLSAALQ